MFLKRSRRRMDGKVHEYWSIVENRRVNSGRSVVQPHVLYLGEINSSEQAAWRKTIEIVEDGQLELRTVALFAEDRTPEVLETEIVSVRLADPKLHDPPVSGAVVGSATCCGVDWDSINSGALV